MMYHPPVFTSVTSQFVSTEITKSIRQCLIGANVPTYEGRKVKERTTTNLSHFRSENDWKIALDRRENQKCDGYFSQISQPYRELGETELNTKDLVVDGMKKIGVVFNMEVSRNQILRKGIGGNFWTVVFNRTNFPIGTLCVMA